MEKTILKKVEKVIPLLMKISKQMWMDYDEDADVLYISFEKPQHADDSIMERDIIIHTREEKIVGLTILHASEFS